MRTKKKADLRMTNGWTMDNVREIWRLNAQDLGETAVGLIKSGEDKLAEGFAQMAAHSAVIYLDFDK